MGDRPRDGAKIQRHRRHGRANATQGIKWATCRATMCRHEAARHRVDATSLAAPALKCDAGHQMGDTPRNNWSTHSRPARRQYDLTGGTGAQMLRRVSLGRQAVRRGVRTEPHSEAPARRRHNLSGGAGAQTLRRLANGRQAAQRGVRTELRHDASIRPRRRHRRSDVGLGSTWAAGRAARRPHEAVRPGTGEAPMQPQARRGRSNATPASKWTTGLATRRPTNAAQQCVETTWQASPALKCYAGYHVGDKARERLEPAESPC